MSEAAPVRDRQMLMAIAAALPDGQARSKVEAHAASLPMTLVRHGLAATMVFMASRKEDAPLWSAVLAGARAVMKNAPRTPADVLALSLEDYLLASELLIASAALTAQWAKVPDARKPEGS